MLATKVISACQTYLTFLIPAKPRQRMGFAQKGTTTWGEAVPDNLKVIVTRPDG